jgi:hypothetical protein
VGWENRRNRRYYYCSRRVGDRVVKEYLGAGPGAEVAAEHDDAARVRRKSGRAQLAALLELIDAASVEADELGRVLSSRMVEELAARGYHQHRGEWRRRRGP